MDLISVVITILVIAVTSAAAFVYSRKYVKSQVKFQIVEDKILLPEELLEQLLDEGKLDEALEVCHTYNLDSDPVYQALWLNSEFTSSAVYDYLTKVSNKTWVLDECLNRVPDDLEATRTLLNYASSLTEYKNILQVRASDDDSTLPGDASELLSSDASKFDGDQRALIQIRLRTLNYLDRLNTFQHLLDGIQSNFIGSEFIEFRDKPIVAAAIDFARSSRFHAITVLFTWHGEQVLPHWLSILDEIPEVISPFHYQNLLPECSVDSVYPWEQATLREKDWSEQIFSLTDSQHDHLSGYTSDSPVTRRESISREDNLSHSPSSQPPPPLRSSTGAPVNASACISREELTCWFIKRAKEIEKLTGSVEHCSLLLKYGLQRNLSSLRGLHDDIEQYATLLYDCLSRSNETIYISYDEFKSFSVEKIVDSLLLSVNNVSTFISCVNRYVKPYLNYLLSHIHSDTNGTLISPSTLCKMSQDDAAKCEVKESAIALIEKEIQLLEALCLVALEFTDIKSIILPSDIRCMKSETLPFILPRSTLAYKKVDVLEKVIQLLCPGECSQETILQMACEKAIQVDDTAVACKYIDQLIALNSVSSWKLAYRLGNNESIGQRDKRIKWLAYSLIYCDENKLLHIVDKIDALQRSAKASAKGNPYSGSRDPLKTWLTGTVTVPHLTSSTNLIQSSRSVISKTAQSLATLFRTGAHEHEMGENKVHQNYNSPPSFQQASRGTGKSSNSSSSSNEVTSSVTIYDTNFGQQEQQVCQVNESNATVASCTHSTDSTASTAVSSITARLTTTCIDVTTDHLHKRQFNSMHDGKIENISDCKGERRLRGDIEAVQRHTEKKSREQLEEEREENEKKGNFISRRNEHRKLTSTSPEAGVSPDERNVTQQRRSPHEHTDHASDTHDEAEGHEDATWDGWE